ncbi:hypothetical protein CYLTODRAFT_425097 [Cylindrobasidium torrendii FP15055 ss-10]|uniref:BZIP domain-containing protein n=1 Tax=Cylindrobasidium torrendii FP15055 ss-10 TaxID=1314674 RepID=A0A0D7B2W1_9AGAR|nr:hypothetical protein CYLTODRAFT_425097 [Cylindrobasidium torrendii FP15055 ss-10]
MCNLCLQVQLHKEEPDQADWSRYKVLLLAEQSFKSPTYSFLLFSYPRLTPAPLYHIMPQNTNANAPNASQTQHLGDVSTGGLPQFIQEFLDSHATRDATGQLQVQVPSVSEDSAERRRIQNREAQRRHTIRVAELKAQLERQLAELNPELDAALQQNKMLKSYLWELAERCGNLYDECVRRTGGNSGA